MLNERDILADVIKDERFMNVNLAFCTVEASPQLKPTLLDLMREEQDLHTRLFQFAQSRGWYPTLWGDLGFQPAGAAATYGAQPYGAAQAYAGFNRQQPGQAAGWQQPAGTATWQQPAGAASWQQAGWQQSQPYNAGIAAAGQYGATAQYSPAFGQFGGRQTTGQVEIAGREYGPY